MADEAGVDKADALEAVEIVVAGKVVEAEVPDARGDRSGRSRYGSAPKLADLAAQSSTHQLGFEVVESFLDRVAHRLTALGVRVVIRPYVGLITAGGTMTGD
jgi:hypothetical protein